VIENTNIHLYVHRTLLNKYQIIKCWNVLQACILFSAVTKAIALVWSMELPGPSRSPTEKTAIKSQLSFNQDLSEVPEETR